LPVGDHFRHRSTVYGSVFFLHHTTGFEKPSLVQQRAICQILLGRDVVVQAQSGTGKTATFCIGSLQRMDESRKETQALFLAPTRELASQIHQVASALADYLSVKCVLCCGGRSNAGEMGKTVEKGSQIVVEMLRQGCLKLNGLRIFVIDEADEMLNQGLRDQLEQICKRLPTASRSSTGDDIFASLEQFQGRTAVQRVVVSATWTSGCREVMQQFLDNPVLILVPSHDLLQYPGLILYPNLCRDELTLSSITQSYIDVGGEEWKFEALADIFASICVPQTVVFVNTRRKVEWLAERLTDEGFAVSAAHGEMDQTSRDSVMGQFRSGRRYLVPLSFWTPVLLPLTLCTLYWSTGGRT
uniref:RNA helicase n=1 Tax=Schistocephalus solidus TaxID=70667 RepID=A0A183TGN0_SCHSO